MTDWAWGVDVSTKLVAIGAVASGHAPQWWSMKVPDAATLRGAQRLSSMRSTLMASMIPLPAPSAIVVEDPIIARYDFRLVSAMAVVYEALHARYRCPVLELRSGTWKKDVIGCGTAGKLHVMDYARALGYDGRIQDEADALVIAKAAQMRLP